MWLRFCIHFDRATPITQYQCHEFYCYGDSGFVHIVAVYSLIGFFSLSPFCIVCSAVSSPCHCGQHFYPCIMPLPMFVYMLALWLGWLWFGFSSRFSIQFHNNNNMCWDSDQSSRPLNNTGQFSSVTLIPRQRFANWMLTQNRENFSFWYIFCVLLPAWLCILKA